MHFFLPWALLALTASAHSSGSLFSKQRRALAGPARLNKHTLASRHLVKARRRNAARSVLLHEVKPRRESAYPAGPLAIAGIEILPRSRKEKRAKPEDDSKSIFTDAAPSKKKKGKKSKSKHQGPAGNPDDNGSTTHGTDPNGTPSSDNNGSTTHGTDPNGDPQPSASDTADSAAPSSSSTSTSSKKIQGMTYDGEATYYTQGGNAGACGTVAQDSDKVVALYTSLYDNGSNCGRMIQITNSEGTTIQAEVRDECPSCSDDSHIDLSVGAFTALGSESAGVLKITWGFISDTSDATASST